MVTLFGCEYILDDEYKKRFFPKVIKPNKLVVVESPSKKMDWSPPYIYLNDKRFSLVDDPLGYINIAYNSEEERVLFKFLDKFAKMQWKDSRYNLWKIEYGILDKACEILARNPRELEDILKIAKTKNQLKVLMGVS